MARRRNDIYAQLGQLVGSQLAAQGAQGIGAQAGQQLAGNTGGAVAPAAQLGGRVGNQAMFQQALGSVDTPGFDAHDQAAAYAAAGAPNISAEFAQKVANGDPETMAFVELLKRGGGSRQGWGGLAQY